MLVKNVDLLIDMHTNTSHCEVCNVTPLHKEVHHIWAKGMGGGSRLDIPWNLIVLCQPCHQLAHAGKISKRELWGIAAEREIHSLRRA